VPRNLGFNPAVTLHMSRQPCMHHMLHLVLLHHYLKPVVSDMAAIKRGWSWVRKRGWGRDPVQDEIRHVTEVMDS